MGVLDGFMSTWSNARNTFGQGTPPTGEQYDKSAPLRGLQADVKSAAPGAHWSGSAAAAYDTVNRPPRGDRQACWPRPAPRRTGQPVRPDRHHRTPQPRRRPSMGSRRRRLRASWQEPRTAADAHRAEGAEPGHRHRHQVQRRAVRHRRPDPHHRQRVPDPRQPEVRRQGGRRERHARRCGRGRQEGTHPGGHAGADPQGARRRPRGRREDRRNPQRHQRRPVGPERQAAPLLPCKPSSSDRCRLR